MSENSTLNEHLKDDEEEDSQRHPNTELTPLNNENAPTGASSTSKPNKANFNSVRSYLSHSNTSTKPGKFSSLSPPN